jgi:hypothetical protein
MKTMGKRQTSKMKMKKQRMMRISLPKGEVRHLAVYARIVEQ